MSDTILPLLFGPLCFFLFPLIIYGTLSVVGVSIERSHEEDLARREQATAGFPVFDLSNPPLGFDIGSGQLVSGNVVLGTGYLKQFTASFRQIFGGEVKGYQRVLDRARREAELRMIETAKQQGAQAIINVRFETSELGNPKQPFSEIFCYGTMVR